MKNMELTWMSLGRLQLSRSVFFSLKFFYFSTVMLDFLYCLQCTDTHGKCLLKRQNKKAHKGKSELLTLIFEICFLCSLDLHMDIQYPNLVHQERVVLEQHLLFLHPIMLQALVILTMEIMQLPVMLWLPMLTSIYRL